MWPLSVGRVDNAFHPAMDHYPMSQNTCKEIMEVRSGMVNRKGAPALIALAVRGGWMGRDHPGSGPERHLPPRQSCHRNPKMEKTGVSP
jgi:hypothetical protein